MMRFKFLALLFLILGSQCLVSQDTISVKDLYFDNYLAHKASTDSLFTGMAQKIRKNGHIVYEETYKDGVILQWQSYFNKSNRRIAEKVCYYTDLPFIPKERITYVTNKKGTFVNRTTYNTEQEKVLFTTHQDTLLIYKCTYKNGKKDGEEFCLDDEGKITLTQFLKGKKVYN